MIRVFQAIGYVRPADRGTNQPILLRGRTDTGDEAAIFVKTTAGYGDRPSAAGVELFTTLLARELGLIAPEPVLVEIPVGLDRVVHDAPRAQALIRASHGTNFGTVALGEDWKTWPVDMSTRAFAGETLGNILAFDGLAQHTDRHPDNPNMMWRAHELAILDHEKCFGHLVLAAGSQHPWREFFSINPFQTHCLRRAVSRTEPDLGQTLWQSLIGLELEGRVPAIANAARQTFPQSGLELDRILRYFDLLNKNLRDFFAYFRAGIER